MFELLFVISQTTFVSQVGANVTIETNQRFFLQNIYIYEKGLFPLAQGCPTKFSLSPHLPQLWQLMLRV
jgi:hypothetical protein